MRRRAILAVLAVTAALALGACPGLAYDGTVTVYQGFNKSDGVYHITGGEFAITTDWTGYYDPANYSTDHRVAYSQLSLSPDFATFCVQRWEYLEYGGTYPVTLAMTTNTPVALDDGAAAVYKQWYSGNLSGYDYANASDRRTDAMYLQRIIWWRMGQVGNLTDSAAALGITDQKYIDWYQTAKYFGETTPGVQGVQILQLGATGTNQDLLVLTADGSIPYIPEPGTFALLATGMLGALPLLRRRRTI